MVPGESIAGMTRLEDVIELLKENPGLSDREITTVCTA